MRRMLLAFTAGLLMFSGSAWADGPLGGRPDGPIIRWDMIEGKHQDGVSIEVGGVLSSARSFVTAEGRALFNLRNGFISIQIRGLSHANHHPAGLSGPQPLGSYIGPVASVKVGTIVCSSTGMGGLSPAVVDTAIFELKEGTGSYHGFVDVPDGCRQFPEDTVFLLRTPPTAPVLPGLFQAYGAARTIR